MRKFSIILIFALLISCSISDREKNLSLVESIIDNPDKLRAILQDSEHVGRKYVHLSDSGYVFETINAINKSKSIGLYKVFDSIYFNAHLIFFYNFEDEKLFEIFFIYDKVSWRLIHF